MRKKITGWLSSAQFLDELVRYELKRESERWRLQFDVDTSAFNRLMTKRLGRTVLITNRMDWSIEQVVAAYGGQQQVEKVFFVDSKMATGSAGGRSITGLTARSGFMPSTACLAFHF